MILGIYGNHKSGKTALIERLINELSAEYSVATIKHIPREFSIDTKNTDTWRHGVAGAKVVVASSNSEVSFIFKNDLNFETITKKLMEMVSPDLILVEGYKNENIPKISVGGIEPKENTIFRYVNNLENIIDYIKNTIGIERVYDKLPKIDCGKCGYDCKKMAELIYKGEKGYADCVVREAKGDVVIDVDNTDIPIGGFVREIFKNTVLGMVSSLKGVKEPREVKIEVRYNR